ncbi:hypothetical protein [Herbidospora cretacea]|uniref:hypothetical protein n=1 Tax=Herbidospora cretacea TaxID=28444 RepID=UPI0007749A3F|nr:hypothetical protein [Herbidospora cretacea]
MITNNPYDRNNAAELDRDDVLADERRHDDKLVASDSVPEPRTADGAWTDRDDRADRDHRDDDLNAETAPVGVAGSAAVTSQEAADEAHRDPALADPDAESVAVAETSTETGTVDDIDFDDRWRDIKAAFVDDPRESVEKADALIDEALSALTSTRQSLVDQWKNSGTNDTEQLRLALREYRNLFDRLKG